jgi:hypothetical protein
VKEKRRFSQRELGRQRCTSVLFHLRYLDFTVQVIRAILSFVKASPDDPSVARFGLGLIKVGSFTKDDELECIDEMPSMVDDNIIRHENYPVVQEYVMAIVTEFIERHDS